MSLRTPERLWYASIGCHRRRWRIAAKALKFLNYALHRCLLPVEAVVGAGLQLDHYALAVVVHPNVTIGRNVRIFHHVTIAGEMPLDSPHRVVIGDNVVIGAGAVILPRPYQGLVIGADATIGAGAVVTRDVPAGATVVGVPARVVRKPVAHQPQTLAPPNKLT